MRGVPPPSPPEVLAVIGDASNFDDLLLGSECRPGMAFLHLII